MSEGGAEGIVGGSAIESRWEKIAARFY